MSINIKHIEIDTGDLEDWLIRAGVNLNEDDVIVSVSLKDDKVFIETRNFNVKEL